MGIQGVGLTYQPQERDLSLRYGLYTLTEDNKIILLFFPNVSDYRVSHLRLCMF